MWARSIALSGEYVLLHINHATRPVAAVPASGWWLWTDQGRYLSAARAWAAGVLDPAQHWYTPGYPLLGAPFVRLMPTQPFFLPDLACLVAALWAFAALTAQLLPGRPGARVLGAAAFAATTAPPQAMDAWVTPWSTTPAAPLLVLFLVFALRFIAAPTPRGAFLAAAAGAGLGLFRPTDAAVALLGAGPFLLAAVVRHRLGPRRAGSLALAALAGGAIPAGLLLAAHMAVHGWHAGPYLVQSSHVGFEWSLLPLRWVLIVLGPLPLFQEGPGLAAAFPWFLPGLAGMAACLATADAEQRRRHLPVIGVTLLSIASLLCYRDLHPQGLWRFGNYHYFKPVLPLLGLYAALLAAGLCGPARRRTAAAGALALAALVPWRATWAPDAGGEATTAGPHDLVLAHGFGSTAGAALLRAHGDWEAIYSGQHALRTAGFRGSVNNDLKAFPMPGGLLVAPLRAFPPAETRITFDPAVSLDQAARPMLGRQRVVLAVPCLLPDRQPSCAVITAVGPVPPRPVPP